MVYKCCAPFCKGNYNKESRAHIFKFPKDDNLKQRWIAAISRKDFEPTKYSRICHKHFTDDEILWTESMVDPKTGKCITASFDTPRLKKGAVPSIFIGCPSYSSVPNKSQTLQVSKFCQFVSRKLKIMEKQEDILYKPSLCKYDPDVNIENEGVNDFHKMLKKEIEDDVYSSQVIAGECLDSAKVKEETDLNTHQDVKSSLALTLHTAHASNNVSDHSSILAKDKYDPCQRKHYYSTSNESNKAPSQEHEINEFSLSKKSRQILVGVQHGQRNKSLQYKLKHTVKKDYKCDICNATLSTRSSVIKHIRRHTGEKPYKCKICISAFVDSSGLTRHKRQHTGERPYKCDICLSTFASASGFACHIRRHTGEKHYKCKICNATFTTRSCVIRHIRKHTGEKPYECDICPSAFAGSSWLKYHKTQQTGEETYKCDICYASFTTISSVIRHKRLHTGEKPYKCDIVMLHLQDQVL